MSKTNVAKVIIAGDWNKRLNKLDKSGGLPWNETNYRNALVNLMKELNLTDIYLAIYPSTRTYANESKSLRFKSTIDFFLGLVSKQFINDDVIKAETRTSIALDHKAIFLSLKIETTLRGERKLGNLIIHYYKMKLFAIRSPLLGACNSHNKPMQRVFFFYRTVYF